MPTTLWLKEFGELLYAAFEYMPYHVGSSLKSKTGWRDVDVRILIPEEEYLRNYGDPNDPHSNAKWRAQVKAWSLLGQVMTGLPIDFQIQCQELANDLYPTKDNPRSALFLITTKVENE